MTYIRTMDSLYFSATVSTPGFVPFQEIIQKKLPLVAYSAYCTAGRGRASLDNSRDVVAEWQRLMRRWDIAYADYMSTCGKHAASDGSVGTPIKGTALEQAKLHLVEIKREIDKLVSQSGRSRAERADPLQITFVEIKIPQFDGKALSEALNGKADLQPRSPQTKC